MLCACHALPLTLFVTFTFAGALTEFVVFPVVVLLVVVVDLLVVEDLVVVVVVVDFLPVPLQSGQVPE